MSTTRSLFVPHEAEPLPLRAQISWAKSTLFATPLANKLLRLMGAVPVKRRQDAETDEKISNDELFASSYAELDAGNIILLFPEGKSGHAPKLFPIKQGVGWLVNGYYKKTGKKIPVVPCALNYMKKEKFRSGVLVQFGERPTDERARCGCESDGTN